MNAPPLDNHSQNYFARAHSNNRLPEPVELANRLEEARTSAKLLEQLVASTPPTEMFQNDLVKEFANRCISASRSIQGYMTAENPGPDNETMESLIDTNEQLQQALNQHQRAVLYARKQLGLNERSNEPSPARGSPVDSDSSRPGGGSSSFQAPPAPPPRSNATLPDRKPASNGKGKATADTWDAPGPSRSMSGTPHAGVDEDEDDERDPFRDPQPERSASGSRKAGGASSSAAPDDEHPRLAYEPFHPGFSGTARPGGSGTDHDSSNEDGPGNAYDVTPPKSGPVYRY